METLGQLVKRLREEKGLSQRALAIYAGVNNTDISRIEKGETTYVRPDLLRKIAKALRVPVSELLKAIGYLKEEECPVPEEFDVTKHPDYIPIKWIPVVGFIHAGELHQAIEYPEARIPIPADMDAEYALTVKGDSMEPFYLEGDRVLVKESPEAYNGQHVVARIDDELAVKIFYKYDHTAVLRSANPRYEDIADKNVRIVGIVKGAVTKR